MATETNETRATQTDPLVQLVEERGKRMTVRISRDACTLLQRKKKPYPANSRLIKAKDVTKAKEFQYMLVLLPEVANALDNFIEKLSITKLGTAPKGCCHHKCDFEGKQMGVFYNVGLSPEASFSAASDADLVLSLIVWHGEDGPQFALLDLQPHVGGNSVLEATTVVFSKPCW